MPALRALGPALLALSFCLGAATEVDLGHDTADLILRGTSAVAVEELELVVPDPPGGTVVLAGTLTRVALVRPGDGVPVAGARGRLDAGEPSAPSTFAGDPGRGPALRCSLVVAAAARTPRLRQRDEDVALEDACRAALSDERPEVPEEFSLSDPTLTLDDLRARAERAQELFDAGRAGPAALRPRVTALEASLVPGTRTAAAVAVRLQSPPGSAAPAGEQVRATYPGGSVGGATGQDGRVLLAVPDVALAGPLPLRVSWRGSAPAGTFVGPLLGDQPDEEPLDEEVEPESEDVGWLREDLPYGLEVVVVREAA